MEKCGTKGCLLTIGRKRGVLTNASTRQTNTQYYMHGLSEYTDEMVDYITSIYTSYYFSIEPKKEKKAVHNELLMHQTYPANPLYNLMNSMLFRPNGLMIQDDTKLQIKNLKNITVEHLKRWFHRFYGAKNIVFVISSDFSKVHFL